MAVSKVKVAIGIDLGTTTSAVGVWRNGKVEIIPNDRGQRTTPSYIAFTGNGGRLVGDAAIAQVATNPKNTVWAFKSLLGRPFDDPAVQDGIPHWPFKVVNVGGKPNVEVEVKGEVKRFTPEELTCLLLLHLRHMAEAYLGQSVADAVITIPAGFNSLQVAATKKAAELAGLNVIKLVSDPTAAALAFMEQSRGSGGDREKKKTILVVNVGGATSGMSLVTVKDTIIKVKATDGNTNVGGEHFTNKLMGEVSVKFFKFIRRRTQADPGDLRRLRAGCEGAKLSLPGCDTVGIDMTLADGSHFITSITRLRFAELCRGLFLEALVDPLDGLLGDAQLERSDIHEIILVGGSSRIPKIQCLLQEYFYGKGLNTTLDPDEAPAHGAAILAAMLTRSGDPLIDRYLVEDVTPFSLGVLTSEEGVEAVTTLIKKGSSLPTKQTYTFTTAYDDQPAVIIEVYEGETGKCSMSLGTSFLSEIPPAPAGVPKIEITFQVDANGTLTVTAVEESTGQEKRITIDSGNGEMLSREDIMKELVDEEAKDKKIQDCQKAYASIKSSYKAVSKLFYSGKEANDFYSKKVQELELEMEGHESLLTPQEFPIVPAPINRRATATTSRRRSKSKGGVKLTSVAKIK